jgi:hypothetical protein
MIETKHLFPILNQKLISLLRSLNEDEWQNPTIARLWNVKNIASHLLDTNLRTLSFARDGHVLKPNQEILSYDDLVAYLNQLNADWIKASERIGTKVLTDLLESTGKSCSDYIQTLNPHDTAIFSVAWAGERVSHNWFHVAREYTEKWHHQQQIREAVNRPGIMTRELFYPFIETLLQGLPHHYRNTPAVTGTHVMVEISSDMGGIWYVVKHDHHWTLSKRWELIPSASIRIPPEIAWKLFTKGISPSDARRNVVIEGDAKLVDAVLNMVAVMA